MKISITKKEYDAIHFAITQIEGDLESSDNEEFNETANESLDALYSIHEKYSAARQKATQLNDVIAAIRKQYHYNIRGSEAAKLARKAIREYYQDNKS